MMLSAKTSTSKPLLHNLGAKTTSTDPHGSFPLFELNKLDSSLDSSENESWFSLDHDLSISHMSLQGALDFPGDSATTEFLTQLGLHKQDLFSRLGPLESWPSVDEDKEEIEECSSVKNFEWAMSDVSFGDALSPTLVDDEDNLAISPTAYLFSQPCFQKITSGDSCAVRSYFRGESLVLHLLAMYPRIAQKSYGRERRFLSPQPLVMLFGSGLTHLISADCVSDNDGPLLQMTAYLKASRKRTGSKGQRKSFQSERLDWTDGNSIGTVDLKRYSFPSNSQKQVEGLLGIFRELHVSQDSEEKAMELILKLHGDDEEAIRVTNTDNIRVVSKPSKKKGPPKKGEATLTYGCKIALFNRTRAQSINTRFLCVTSNGRSFEAKYTMWDTFEVQSSDITSDGVVRAHQLGDTVNHGAIVVFGSEIILRHSLSKLTATPFIVRSNSHPSADQPVPQLQRLALELRDHPGQYLAVVNDTLTTITSTKGPLPERALWMMVTVDVISDSIAIMPQELSSSQWRSSSPLQRILAEKPTCTVHEIVQQSGRVIRLLGQGFQRHYWVYFGLERARDVLYYSDSCIKVEAPFLLTVYPSSTIESLNTENQTQIVLVDPESNTLYPTRFEYKPI